MPSPLSRSPWPAPLVVLLLACGSSASPDDVHEPDRSAQPSPAGGASSLSRGPATGLPPLRADEPTFTVLSFNINFGVGHEPVNAQAVADADADLVLLQETTDRAEVVFRRALSETYPHMLFQSCCRAGGLGVLSRHPIRQEVYLEPNVGWFPAWWLLIDSPLGPVQVLNVHLRPPVSDDGSWVSGYFSTGGIRAREIADFWTAMSEGIPALVVGDFNENRQGQAIDFLVDKGLHSALPQFSPRAKTWRWPTRVGEIHAQLDHIVHGPRLVPRSAEVLDAGNSDHLPVLAVFTHEPKPPDPNR